MSGLFGSKSHQGNNQTTPMEVSLRVQTSAYGMVLPVVYGRNRVPGNLMWYGDFKAIPHTTSQEVGGKGGGGGTITNTSYTYTTSFAFGLCEGAINQIGTVWRDKEVITGNNNFMVMEGSMFQNPWPYLTSKHPDQALSYRGVAYAAASNYDLGASSSLQNHSFEIFGKLSFDNIDNGDIKLPFALTDYLTNKVYGAALDTAYVDSWESWKVYSQAAGLFFSPVFQASTQAAETLTLAAKLTNTGIYFSEGKIKAVPYGDSEITGNGETYTPNLTPLYEITDEDFIADGDDPVHVKRGSIADAYNQVQVEFVNRANGYNVEVAEAKDQGSIDVYGLRTMEEIKCHWITSASVARNVAQQILQRAMYIRNTYEFKLGMRYCLLEPTDYITITDSRIGLIDKPVRITRINEEENGTFSIQAEDAPNGVFSTAAYPSAGGQGHNNDYGVNPDNTNQPVIFEPPAALVSNSLEVWLGVSGQNNWGGCQVWVSYDDASYTLLTTVLGSSRQGVLTAPLATGEPVDTDNTLSVDLSMSNSQIQSVSTVDARAYSTLSYVDGELLAYRDVDLTAPYEYDVTYLLRGLYGSDISSHNSGTQYMRLDGSLSKIPFTPDKIGKTLYVKLPAFNQYGQAQQQLSDVPPYLYTIKGNAARSPLPDITNLQTNFNNYVGGLSMLYWDEVIDFRQPLVDYEVRFGATWHNSQVLGHVKDTKFTAISKGRYWVSAHYLTENGTKSIYSDNPASIDIEETALASNVIASWSEADTFWQGSMTTGIVIEDNILQFEQSGGVYTENSGIYTLPPEHTIDVGNVTLCNLLIDYDYSGVALANNILAVEDVYVMDDILDISLGELVSVTPQFSIAGEDEVYSDWKNFVPGYYNGRYFKARFLVNSRSPFVTPAVTDFVLSIDAPDRVDTGSISLPDTGGSVVYNKPFNGGNAGTGYPSVLGSIVNAGSGETLQITNQTVYGFTAQVVNSNNVGVARTVNWVSQGY
jgi:hypothetical protein